MDGVLEAVVSTDERWKAEIVRRPSDGLLQVRLYRWCVEDVADLGTVAEFWSEQTTAASITDELAIARSIARELIGNRDPNFRKHTVGRHVLEVTEYRRDPN